MDAAKLVKMVKKAEKHGWVRYRLGVKGAYLTRASRDGIKVAYLRA